MEVLFDQSTRSWKLDMVDHVFVEANADAIKSIPLSSSPQQDTLMWPFTPMGQYFVKSGYRFLQESEVSDQVPVTNFGFWRDLWSLEVPSKVKNFVWRACREALPTKANFCRRKVITATIYENCMVMMEDCSHAIFFCSELQEAWTTDPQWSWLATMGGKTMLDIFKHAFREDRDPSLLAFMAWTIWYRQSQVRFKEVACPLNCIDQLSKERKSKFQNLHPVRPKQQHVMHTKWKPLDLGCFKVNYDDAIFLEVGRVGIRAVIRNSDGVVMASLSQQIPQPATIAQVEAIAARRAVKFALEIGITSPVFEGDSDTI